MKYVFDYPITFDSIEILKFFLETFFKGTFLEKHRTWIGWELRETNFEKLISSGKVSYDKNLSLGDLCLKSRFDERIFTLTKIRNS